MKKSAALLTALALALSLCACSAIDNIKNIELPPIPTTAPEETPAPEPTQAPAVTEAPAAAAEAPHVLANHVVVGISASTQDFYDQQYGTQKILSFSYETPAVYVEGREEASESINEYIARLEETYVTGNDYGVGTSDGINLLLEQAQDNYAVNVENNLNLPLEYASDMSVKTGRLDEQCAALIYTYYLYTGGAHGNYADKAYVFDSETGELATIDKLSDNSAQLREYLRQCILELKSEDKDKYYSERIWEDYFTDTTMEEAFKGLVRDGNWYFDNEGMCIFSDPYEIAPYAAGIIEFHIPYSKLKGHVDSKWIKAPESESGELTAKVQEEITDGSVEIIDRVVTDEVGREIALMADGAIYQVKLSKVEYLDTFYETQQLWGCSYMKDCALQVVTDIPDSMPNLMVSYLDAEGNTHSKVITFSGDDGHIILMDKDAVSAQG